MSRESNGPSPTVPPHPTPTPVTPAALLLGLSRRPLSPADEARARRLTPAVARPPQRGLALLSVESLTARSADLAAGRPDGIAPLPPPPPHPDLGGVAPPLLALVRDLRALKSDGLARLLRRRGLLLPAAALPDELARLKRQRSLTADDFLGLGPRGAYLLPLAERSPYREATLFSPQGLRGAFAKTAAERARQTRAPLVGYVLGLLGATGLPEELKRPYRAAIAQVLTAAELPAPAGQAALVLLGHDRLGATVAPDVLAQALSHEHSSVPLPALVQSRLLKAAGPLDTACAKTLQDASTQASELLSAHPRTAAPAADQLAALAAATFLLDASATAADLLCACVTADDRLLGEHPALGTLLAAMDAADFARSLHAFAERSPRGWAHPLLPPWLADTDHRLGPEDSERLVADALSSYGPAPGSLATRFPLRLDPDVAEVLHAFEQQGRGGALARRLASVLAQAPQIAAAYPRL